MIELLTQLYQDFDCIEENHNADYEGLLIKVHQDNSIKRFRLAKKTPKKAGYFTAFWQKDENQQNIPYSDQDLADTLIIGVIDGQHRGLFLIPKDAAIKHKILSTQDSKGKMAMRFYPPWCLELNKTAQRTQKWQLDYFKPLD